MGISVDMNAKIIKDQMKIIEELFVVVMFVFLRRNFLHGKEFRMSPIF